MWAFYHTSPRENPESILEQGLIGHLGARLWTWRDHGQPCGNYLMEVYEDAQNYAAMLSERGVADVVDIWQVDASELPLEWDPEERLLNGEVLLHEISCKQLNARPRWYIPVHVKPARLTLLETIDFEAIGFVEYERGNYWRVPYESTCARMTAKEYPDILETLGEHEHAAAWRRGQESRWLPVQAPESRLTVSAS